MKTDLFGNRVFTNKCHKYEHIDANEVTVKTAYVKFRETILNVHIHKSNLKIIANAIIEW